MSEKFLLNAERLSHQLSALIQNTRWEDVSGEKKYIKKEDSGRAKCVFRNERGDCYRKEAGNREDMSF